MKHAELYFYSIKINLILCFYFQSSRSPWWQEEDGKNKPRWRAKCPTNGGVRKVGVFIEWVISNGTETIDMYEDNIHCNVCFSAGKCLHIQCRRGAWCYLPCGNTVIVLKLLLASCSCLEQFHDARLGIPTCRGQTDRCSSYLSHSFMLEPSWHRCYDYIWLLLCLELVLFRLNKNLVKHK